MAVVPPIVTSTTFKQNGPAEYEKYDYSRSANPTREVLEGVLAKLDNAKYALAFSSGLGATTALLGMLNSGDHIIVGDDIYGGTNRLLNKVISRFSIKMTFTDLTDINNLEKAIEPNTKLIWLESPTNPTMKVVDLRAAAAVAKKHNIYLTVDNTFLTPYLQRPLDLGADLTIYSISKYINGHADVIMGSIATNNEEIFTKMKFLQNAMGIVPAPFDCYQVNRGLKTLALRMQKHKENARLVGLPSHPQHELFKKQTSGHSGTFSIYLKGGLEESKIFLKALKIFSIASSLGGYESLIGLPCLMTHASIPPELKKKFGISDSLIRLSVGLEDPEDLIADLDQALRKLFLFVLLYNRKLELVTIMGEEHGYLPFPKSIKTLCVHNTDAPKRQTCKEIMAPIFTSNMCSLESAGGPSQIVKGRLQNPTRSVLESLVKKLCNTKYGLCYASGIGAISAVFGLLKSGDHLLCSDDVYGGTCKALLQVSPNFGLCTSFVDLCDIKSLPDHIRPETKLIWAENPTNPTLKVVDLCALTKIAKERNLLLAVDNTFLSPYLQRPADFGVDLVVNSVTKYMNGHSDVIMGAVCTNSEDLYKKLKFIQERVYIKGDLNATHKFIDNLKLFVHAVSLGGYESLVQIPTLLSHGDTPKELKEATCLTDNLIRVTVGLEYIGDLIEDFEQALDKI
ncbi:unnamed protein product [Callosobruchus maculatus]|uniref:cystathionine gamma-lyase n=1 Tax=Callosobruchus maculatus TaxID=64391 RepID=A0A653BHA3_CALMS|nr:unnamed protein product [Callosobruchus maculatus]